jgi:hypothetical protein
MFDGSVHEYWRLYVWSNYDSECFDNLYYRYFSSSSNFWGVMFACIGYGCALVHKAAHYLDFQRSTTIRARSTILVVHTTKDSNI